MYYKIAFILLSIIITLITLFSYQNNSLAQNEDPSTNTFPEMSQDYSCHRVKGGCDESPADIGKFIELVQNSELTEEGQNKFSTTISVNAPNSILSEIERIVYYLHPTFNPNERVSYTKENNFSITFTNWGLFDLKAKVYFKDGTNKDLELPKEKWKLP